MRRAAGIGKESDSDLRAAGALRVGPDRPPGRRAEGGGPGRGFCRGKAQHCIPCIPSGLVSAEPLPARCSLFPSAVLPAAAASALTMASEVVAGLVFFENRSEQQPQPHVSRECA